MDDSVRFSMEEWEKGCEEVEKMLAEKNYPAEKILGIYMTNACALLSQCPDENKKQRWIDMFINSLAILKL